MWGVTAEKASHNASNARGVTAGKMECNSSLNNTQQMLMTTQNYYNNIIFFLNNWI